MWPFSTLKHLRWEIEQANTANEIMRTALTRRDERLGEAQHALIMVKGSLIAEENKVRELKGQLVISEHATQAKDASIRQLNGTISGMQSMNKGLAAERDEAVLRARHCANGIIERNHRIRALEAVIEAQKHCLRGALVRDPKTGRMTKWQEQPPGEAPFDFLGTGRTSEADDTVNFDRVMAGLHDTVRK